MSPRVPPGELDGTGRGAVGGGAGGGAFVIGAGAPGLTTPRLSRRGTSTIPATRAPPAAATVRAIFALLLIRDPRSASRENLVDDDGRNDRRREGRDQVGCNG